MKKSIKFFVVISFLFFSTYSYAEQKIAYIDMKIVLNNSKAGKGAQDQLTKTFKLNQKKYTDMEKKLRKEETDLISSKASISKEDYQSKSKELRKKVQTYQTERKKSLDKIAQQRAEARKQLLKKLDPIIENYIKENNINILIDKKSVVMSTPEFDITKTVVEKLNKELPSLKLK